MKLITGSEIVIEGDGEERLGLSYDELRQEFENHIVAKVSNRLGSRDHPGVQKVVDRVLDSLKKKVLEDDLPEKGSWRAWINEECLRSSYDELRQEFERLIVAQVSYILGSPAHHGVREVVDRVLESLKKKVFKDETLPNDWKWRAWISKRSQQRTHDYLRRFGESRQISVNFNDLEDAIEWDVPPSFGEARAAFNVLSSETSLRYSILFNDEQEALMRFLAAAAIKCKITLDEMVAWKLLEQADILPANKTKDKTRNAFNAPWSRFLTQLFKQAEDIELALRGEATRSRKKKSLETLQRQFQENFGITIGEYRVFEERFR